MHNTSMDENNSCLIFHSDCTTRDHQLYFVDFPACRHGEEKVKRFQVPFREALPKFHVVGSSNGLLCLSDSLQNDALYVYNPFTENYIDLPKSTQYPNQKVSFGFWFHPTKKEYKVIKLVHYRKAGTIYRCGAIAPVNLMDSEVQIFTLGSSTWRSLGKANFLYQWSSQVLVNGKLHWVAWRRTLCHGNKMIISFELVDEQFRGGPITPLKGICHELVVLGGCLFAAVYLNFGTLEIWVMREYGVEESWIKKLNIKAHVPKGLEAEDVTSIEKFPRVLCLLKTGEILLEYKRRVLVSYDPKSGDFKDLMFQGIPKC